MEQSLTQIISDARRIAELAEIFRVRAVDAMYSQCENCPRKKGCWTTAPQIFCAICLNNKGKCLNKKAKPNKRE